MSPSVEKEADPQEKEIMPKKSKSKPKVKSAAGKASNTKKKQEIARAALKVYTFLNK